MTGSIQQGRFELKYALPLSVREGLLAAVADHVRPDPHAVPLLGGGQGYRVHSLYYDTTQNGQLTLGDYKQRLSGRRIRNRLRARTYGLPGEEQPVFLENKRKGESRVVKSRLRICSAASWHRTAGPYPWQAFAERVSPRKRFAYDDFNSLVAGHRAPVSVVHYLREVYVPQNTTEMGVRLTLDREVCATTRPRTLDLYAPPDVNLIPPDWMVMEMKFSGTRPHWMCKLVQQFRLQAVPVSKFGLSVVLGFRADRRAELRFFTPQPLRASGMIASPAPILSQHTQGHG